MKKSTSSGPGLQVSPGGLPSAGFGSAGNQSHGVTGPFGGASQATVPPGMQMGGSSAPRTSQSGDMSKEGTPISTASGSGQGPAGGGKGPFSSRTGGRGGK